MLLYNYLETISHSPVSDLRIAVFRCGLMQISMDFYGHSEVVQRHCTYLDIRYTILEVNSE